MVSKDTEFEAVGSYADIPPQKAPILLMSNNLGYETDGETTFKQHPSHPRVPDPTPQFFSGTISDQSALVVRQTIKLSC